jgi:hypothetical protein
MCGDYHHACVRKRSKLYVNFSEGYLDMRPLDSYYGALNSYMIHLVVMLLFLSLVFEVQIGTSNNGVDGFKGWETGCLLGGILILW